VIKFQNHYFLLCSMKTILTLRSIFGMTFQKHRPTEMCETLWAMGWGPQGAQTLP
jgi:hypothetical protein